jgi:hypothetical protein
LRIIDAELLQSEHRHADAKYLAGTEMTVGDFGFAEKFVE